MTITKNSSKHLKAIIFVVLSCSITSCVAAQGSLMANEKWEVLDELVDDRLIYIDLNSIKTTSEKHVEMVAKIQGASEKVKFDLDCNCNSSRYKQIASAYSGTNLWRSLDKDWENRPAASIWCEKISKIASSKVAVEMLSWGIDCTAEEIRKLTK